MLDRSRVKGARMIYFVGAGARDPDLITVKRAESLGPAIPVIYAGSPGPWMSLFLSSGRHYSQQREAQFGRSFDL